MTFIKRNVKRIVLIFFTFLVAFSFAACDRKPNEDDLKMQDALNSIALGSVSPAYSTFVLPRNTTIRHELDITWSLECEDGTAALELRGDKWYVIITPTEYEENAEGEPINEWGRAKLIATVSIGKRSKAREWDIEVYPGERKILISTIKADYKKDDEVVLSNVLVVHKIDKQGFLVEDESGCLYIYDRGATAVEAGDTINLEGKVDFYGDAIQIASSKITILLSDNPVDYDNAEEITIEGLLALDSTNQLNFNKLYKVEGYLKTSKSGTSNRFYLEAKGKEVLLHYSAMESATETILLGLANKYISLKAYTFGRISSKITLMVLPETIQEETEPVLTPEEKADMVIADVKPLYEGKEYVIDLDLVEGGEHDAIITWSSNKPVVIANDGKLTIPTTDTVVVLTATIKIGDYTKSVNINVTAKAVALSNIGQVIDLVNANNLQYVRTAGVVVGKLDDRYYLADASGVIALETVQSFVVGDKIELIAKAKVVDRTSTYFRVIYEPYYIEKVDEEQEDPLDYVEANVDDFDFNITSSNINTSAAAEKLYQEGVALSVYVEVDGDNVYLVDELGDEQKLLVLGQTGSLKSLEETKVSIKAVVIGYGDSGEWVLYFLNRAGDLETEEDINEEQLLVIALSEINSIVREGKYIDKNLEFLTDSNDPFLENVKYSWTTDKLTIIDEAGKFTAPNIDTAIKITVNIYLRGDINVEPDEVKEINVIALADIDRISDIRGGSVGDSVIAIGIVTARVGNNAYIQDHTAGIYVFCSSNTSFHSSLAVGNLVEVVGTFDEFYGSKQIAQVTAVTVLGTEKELPEAIDFDEKATIANLLSYSGSVVDITGFRIKTIPTINETPAAYDVIITNGKVNFVIRVDQGIASNDYVALRALFTGLLEGQPINVNYVPIGEFSGAPQLALSNANQIEILNYSDEDKANYVLNLLEKNYDEKAYESGRTVNLESSYSVLGATIAWESNNPVFNTTTGLLGEVTEDTVIELTISVSVGSAVQSRVVSITVKPYVELELLYHFDFEEVTVVSYTNPPTEFLNKVDSKVLTLNVHRVAVNTPSTVGGATKALVLSPRTDTSDSKAWIEFDFEDENIRKIEFDTFFWNISAKSLLEKCELQVKVDDEWVTLFDLYEELGTDVSIHSIEVLDIEGSLFRFYAEGTTSGNNNARILVDNLKFYGN